MSEDIIEAIIGWSGLIALAVAFVSIFWYPLTSIAASIYALVATTLKK